jgi:hypothetical protein
MKTPLLFTLPFFATVASAQITTPMIKSGFGVDADLRARYFNGALQNGNDDWFILPGTTGNLGQLVIDTTGAAAIVAGYTSDVSPFKKRMASLYRPMSVPKFSVVNNRLWLDALWVRDYHGNDTTVFTAGSDKNGMSPAEWSGGVQSIPDKNDILDMFVHVRRAGPTATDSLWLFGGLSLDNTTGNRYFDFEMYQTDINYDRTSGKWYGYGPNAGHTSWQFDASGQITRPGDIIFSAEYQNSSLTNIEARIWIDQNSLSITPQAFNWSGQFDGANAGARFGYASILPKTAGAFYTGIGSGNNTWAGAFQLILQNNALAVNYAKDQFMEFSVNLSKLGLDPVTLLGGDICGSPFNRIVVKTRASSSFTAELKDFVAPTDLFLAPRVSVVADVPVFCSVIGASNLMVQNPSSSSVYTWTTPNGHIYGSNTGPTITADAPGTYIVMQQLAAGCNPYAYDTVVITYDATCSPLDGRSVTLNGQSKEGNMLLNWTSSNNELSYFDLQRSFDGRNFETINRTLAVATEETQQQYSFSESSTGFRSPFVFYRLLIKANAGQVAYSKILRLKVGDRQTEVLLYPNPVKDWLQVTVVSAQNGEAKITVFDMAGAAIRHGAELIKAGINELQLDASPWKPGTYLLSIDLGNEQIRKKIIVSH